MDETAQNLVASMLATYKPHVESRLAELNLDSQPPIDAALAKGEAWLKAQLEEMLALPFDRQSRGPLEIFQEAMRFPTRALAATGAPAVARDSGSEAALPGDVYDLAPASSRQLGERVWAAHLAWGVTKARSLQRSRQVGLLSGDLMDRSRIESLVERSGATLVIWSRAGAVPVGAQVDLALVDLTATGALAAIEELAGAGARVIAFGPHVDREALRKARQLGAEQVLARSAFFANLGELLG